MSTFSTKSARSLYDGGDPLPGVVSRDHGGKNIVAGYANGAVPFGRIVSRAQLESDDSKSYRELDNADTLIGGISVYSFDAIDDVANLRYSDGEAMGVLEEGYVIMETAEDMPLNPSNLGIVNGENSGDEDDIGKLTTQTGAGYSAINPLSVIRIVRKISSTLVEVYINAGMVITPG